MSTDGGKCGPLEKAINMEQELLEPQLFPLINSVKIWKLKRDENMVIQGVASYSFELPLPSAYITCSFLKPVMPTQF